MVKGIKAAGIFLFVAAALTGPLIVLGQSIETAGAGLGPRSLAQTQADPETGAGRGKAEQGPARPYTARKAMVVTANPHATQAGLSILRTGGRAVDALAAAQFVLNVVEPQSSGIGGGGFLLYYNASTGEVTSIDGREEAPAAATPDMFLQPDGRPVPFYPDRITGGKAVGVPGLVMALSKALRLYGNKNMAQVLKPAVRLASEGFIVSPRLAALLERDKKRLARFPSTKKIFFDSKGKILREGALLKQPELAATLLLMAEKGTDSFYRGEIARDIVRAVREAPINPGLLTRADLAGYQAPLRAPVKGTFRGYTLYGMGPPSSGGVTLFQILHLLEAAPPKMQAPAEASIPWTGIAGVHNGVHYFVQAVRMAYADRARYLADPDFSDVPVGGLLDRDYSRHRAAGLDWAGPLQPSRAGSPKGGQANLGADRHPEAFSTTHLTVVDEHHNVALMTSSIEMAFGSGMVVPGRGFLLNNQLTDFSPLPQDDQGRKIANRVEGGRRLRLKTLDGEKGKGGKRPRSSMAPTLVLKNGKPVLALGSPGGSRIIQYVAGVILKVLDRGLDLQSAINAPHITHMAETTFLEEGGDWEALQKHLPKLGHKILIRPQNSGLHGIWLDPATGLLTAGVDPRREGMAAGY